METSLKVIKNNLNELIGKLSLPAENVNQVSGTSLTKLKSLKEFRVTISQFQDLGIFDQYVSSLINSVIFTTSNDEITLQNSEAQSLISVLNNLKILSQSFLSTLTRTLPEESADSINIKLPEVKDFEELSTVAKDLHIALSQILFNEDIKGEEKIISVENGSIWFNVFVGGPIAVGLIATLAWAAAVIYKKVQEGKLLSAQVKGLQVKNESLEDILKAQKLETEMMINAEAEHIDSEFFKENAPENIERIKNSIRIFSNLIERGAEINPALIAPEQVANLFPNTKNLVGLESKIKKLTN